MNLPEMMKFAAGLKLENLKTWEFELNLRSFIIQVSIVNCLEQITINDVLRKVHIHEIHVKVHHFHFCSFLLVFGFHPAACILFFLSRIFHISTIVVPAWLLVFNTSFHLCGFIFTAGAHFVVIKADLTLFTHLVKSFFQSQDEVWGVGNGI